LLRAALWVFAAIALCVAAHEAAAQSLAGPPLLAPPDVLSPPIETAPSAPPSAASSAAPAYGDLESLLPPPMEAVTGDVAAPLAGAAARSLITPTPHWYEPTYWFGEDPWTAGIELGINGSEGNNNVFSMRAGGHAKRETTRWKFDSSLVYNKNHSNGVETQNNGKQDARLDRNLADSAWTLFVLENLIYDEFQAFDVQLSVNSGVGYRWIKTETLDFLTRFGAGATREFGGPEEDWQPTALFGLDYEHKITKMQRAVAKVDYYPEWEDYRNYRVVTDLGWQIDLDRPKNMSLKLSAIDRYDSTPDGAVPNNLDYAVLLIWGL
jgi:putative salt-induced outer membrane protein YdiY